MRGRTFPFRWPKPGRRRRDSWDGMVEFLDAPTPSNLRLAGSHPTWHASNHCYCDAGRDQAMVSLGSFGSTITMRWKRGNKNAYMSQDRAPVLFSGTLLVPMCG